MSTVTAPAHVSWRALGTTVSVLVADAADLVQAEAITRADVAGFDAACSRFREDSDLSRVNAAAGRPVVVSPLLVDAVETALWGARLTGGLVDPTVGRAIRLLGYDRDFAGVTPCAGPLTFSAEAVPGWQCVEIDTVSSTIRIPPGVELDLGASGKARCADWIASQVSTALDGRGVLINLGGDIATAGPAPEGGWLIRVADRHDAGPADFGQTVSITGGGLATSGTTIRRWRRGGVTLHHLIDPATGLPAKAWWRTVSVCAGTCVDANVASTAAMLSGADAPAWLAGQGLPARLVTVDGGEVRVGDWPDEVAP